MTQPQRQTTAERLDQAPMRVWFPEWPEKGDLPALPASPLERRTQRRFRSDNRHLSASVTLVRARMAQRNASCQRWKLDWRRTFGELKELLK